MFKKLSLYTLLLCLVPFFIWLSGYHWSAHQQLNQFDYYLYWLTETGSVPYAIISCMFFALLFAFLFKTRRQWFVGVVIMALAVISTQAVKVGMKALFAEPRPFVVYFAEQTQSDPIAFYQLKRPQRAELIQQFYHSQIPNWLNRHYQAETGYSFPSGHSIFAATWLMLAVGFVQLLGKRTWGAKLLIGGIFIWSVLMMISRVRLGMHYPIDLLASILAAWVVHLVIFSGFCSNKKFNALVLRNF